MKKVDLVSIIIPVKNEGVLIQQTINSLNNKKTNKEFEIIVVDDDSTDDCCNFLQTRENIKLIKTDGVGAAMARNIGATQANGDIFIFCDGHLVFEDFWMDKLVEPIEKNIGDAVNPGIADIYKPSKVGYGYTWNQNLEPKWNKNIKSLTSSPLLAGGCLAISENAFDVIDGFEKGFKVWGREDEEISLKLWLNGFTCLINPKVTVYHYFRPTNRPYSVSWEHVYYNLLRMAYSHFSDYRIEKCKKLVKPQELPLIEEELLSSDILMQRNRYLEKRLFDDDWYMSKFNIHF